MCTNPFGIKWATFASEQNCDMRGSQLLVPENCIMQIFPMELKQQSNTN